MEYDIKSMIVGGKMVTFTRYCHGQLWYKTECGFEFPVPIRDVEDNTLLNTDKAILFMKWINLHILYINRGYIASIL